VINLDQINLKSKPVPLIILCLCAFGLLAATALFAVPGYLTWDAGTYHLMVRTFFRTGTFFISNGYEQLQSPLLAIGHTMVKEGGIVSQYPEYYTLLSLPFYVIFGYRGLIVLNAFAFIGTCVMIFRMTRWFSTNAQTPLVAVLVYSLATFAAEYTQSSYPHMTTTFLLCTSIWLLWGVDFDDSSVSPTLFYRIKPYFGCIISGLLFGLSMGVRLDSVFTGLALGVPLLAMRRFDIRHILAFISGTLPPLLGLAWINMIKFGKFSPFTYGKSDSSYISSFNYYLPIASVCIFFLLTIFWHRIRPFHIRRRSLLFILLAAAIIIVLLPQGRRLLHGVFQIVVDMRIRPDIWEPGLVRSAGGAVVFWGRVKKALLESCPYLVLIFIPMVRGLVKGDYGIAWLLWLVPAGFVGFYGYPAMHGSVAGNMRYLNPSLPFLSMLASLEIVRICKNFPVRKLILWVSYLSSWFGFIVILQRGRASLELQEMLYLNTSLILAAVLLLLQMLSFWSSGGIKDAGRKLLAAMLPVTLVWSSALAFMDYRASTELRSNFLEASKHVENRITQNALVLVPQPDFAWPLLDCGKNPVIADYTRGTEDDAVELVENALASRQVYWLSTSADELFSRTVFRKLQEHMVPVQFLYDAGSGPFNHRLYLISTPYDS
jgi:hypothetical protein